MDNLWTGVVSVMLAIVGVATLSVILSKKSNTQGVIASGGNALAQNIGAAVSPITGASVQMQSVGVGNI